MGKLLAGIDVSGNPKDGNYKFMAIVIGTQEKINSIFKYLDPDQKYIYKNSRNRDILSSRLRFDSKEIIAFCIRIDRKMIIDKMIKKKKIDHTSKSSGAIFHIYNTTLLYNIRNRLDTFVNQHNYSLTEILFQCDMDCKKFLKDSGLHNDNEGLAYILSDLVAWANNRNKEPAGVISIDLVKILKEQLVKFG